MAIKRKRRIISTRKAVRGAKVSVPWLNEAPYVSWMSKHRPFDLAKSRALLEAAGWRMNAGVREQAGQSSSIRLVLERGHAEERALGMLLQKNLQAVGLTLKLSFLRPQAWRKRVYEQRDFDLTIDRRVLQGIEVLWSLFHSQGKLNYMSYRNPHADKALDALLKSKTSQESKQAREEFERSCLGAMPVIPLRPLSPYAGFSIEWERRSLEPFSFFHRFSEWR